MPVLIWTGAAMSATPVPVLRADGPSPDGTLATSAEPVGPVGMPLPALPVSVGAVGTPGTEILIGASPQDHSDFLPGETTMPVVGPAISSLWTPPDGTRVPTGAEIKDGAKPRPTALAPARLPVAQPAPVMVSNDPQALDLAKAAVAEPAPTPAPARHDGSDTPDPDARPEGALAHPAETLPSAFPETPGAVAAIVSGPVGLKDQATDDSQYAKAPTDRSQPDRSLTATVLPTKAMNALPKALGPVPAPATALSSAAKTVLAVVSTDLAPSVLPSPAPPESADTLPPAGHQNGSFAVADQSEVTTTPQVKVPGFWERFFTDLQARTAPQTADSSLPASAPIPDLASPSSSPFRGVEADVEAAMMTAARGMSGKDDRWKGSVPTEHTAELPSPPTAVSDPKLAANALTAVDLVGQDDPQPDQTAGFDPSSLTLASVPGGTFLAAVISSTPTVSGLAAAAAMVPQITQLLSEATAASSDGATEFALSPDELGHVRLRLKPDAANPDRMVVMITFERPETLELFRRHAGELADALRTAGYAGADIGFGQDGTGSFGSDHRERTFNTRYDSATGPASPDPTDPAPRHMAGASLDLRL